VDNHKLAAGQQDGAGDAGGINRVAVIGGGERVAQRAGAAVIRVCDYDHVSWQSATLFADTLLALPNLAALWFRSVSLCERQWNHAYRQP